MTSLGSAIEEKGQTWQIPVCARWSRGGREERGCTLLQDTLGRLQLGEAAGCPEWVLPNEGMAGYYRVALASL